MAPSSTPSLDQKPGLGDTRDSAFDGLRSAFDTAPFAFVDGEAGEFGRYKAALDFFRLTWNLQDLTEYLNVLRSPHQENDDTVRQYQTLMECAAIRDTWSSIL